MEGGEDDLAQPAQNMGGAIGGGPAAVDIEDVQLEEEGQVDESKVSKAPVSAGAGRGPDNRNPSQVL